MSGLIGSILNTTNAIKANQLAIETAGKNMNNVNNTAYSRQRVEFGISGGVSQTIITQQRDLIIESKIVRESSVTGSLDAQNRVNEQLQVIWGEEITQNVDSPETLEGSTTGTGGGTGLSSMLDDFFNAFHALSTDPEDIPTKAALLAEAEELVNRMNSLSIELSELDEDVLKNIDADVGQVNALLNEIATINQEIAKIEIRDPGGAHEFRDLRQQKLEELAKYIDFETEERDNGQILVTARDKSSTVGSSVTLVDKNSVTNYLAFNKASNEIYFTNYTTRPLGNSPNTTATNLTGGTLHGYTYQRSTTDPFGGAASQAVGPLAKMREDLDILANELATQVNALYNDAPNDVYFFDDDANPDAPDLTNLTAANITLYKGDPTNAFGGGVIAPLNSTNLKATNTTNTGANELAISIAELNDFTSSNLRGNTFTEFISDVTTSLGYSVSNTKQQLENQTLIVSQLQEQRASVSGVSLDEELANIIRYQRSFEASARVLQALDEMLEIITNQLAR